MPADDLYRRGERLDADDYVIFRDYDRYRLRRPREGEVHHRDGTLVCRVDRETRRVLELIRLADIVLGD